MEAKKRKNKAQKAYDTLCQNNRFYMVPEALSLEISKEIYEVSLKAHKEYLFIQSEALRNLRDKRYI